MKTIVSFVFVLACASLCQCLSYSSHIQHMQAAEQQAYLDQLLKIQSNLVSQLDQFSQVIDATNRNASQFANYPTIQAQTLEAGLQSQRQILQTALSQLDLPPISKKTWDCKVLTKAEIDAINSQISETQKNSALLQSKLAAETNCEKNQQILTQIQFLSVYVDHLGKQVNSNCGTPVAKIVYVPNSKNQYYTYGSQGEQAYNAKIQQLLTQQYTKLECPVEAPFPKDNQCVGCPTDGLNFYDLTQQKCFTCPPNYTYMPQNHTCLMKSYNSNPQAINYIGTVPAAATGVETCPLTAPFFNGQNCIGCPDASFFDFGSLICKVCPNGTIFDKNTHLCVYQKYNTYVDKDSKNYCCGVLANDTSVQTCPKATPFFNGKQCVACQMPAYFSIQTLSCSLCPEGQGFSLVQYKCIDSKYLQPVYTTVMSPDLQNYFGTPPKYDQQFERIISCPSERPYFNNATNMCSDCFLPNFYNFDTNQCLVCPAGYKFDLTSHNCTKIVTTQMNSNLEVLNNFIGTVPNYDNTLATCPKDKPFFNSNQCVSCTLPSFADFNTQTCKQCPAEYTFNTLNRQCTTTNPRSFTNLAASNIFYNGDFTGVTSSIQSIKSSYPNAQECPSATPFFNAQDNTCIKCPSDYPLFDFKYNRCIVCADNSSYNTESRICILNGNVGPTVERMIMNTVGWL